MIHGGVNGRRDQQRVFPGCPRATLGLTLASLVVADLASEIATLNPALWAITLSPFCAPQSAPLPLASPCLRLTIFVSIILPIH